MDSGVVVIVLIVAVLVAVVVALYRGNFSFSHRTPASEIRVGASTADATSSDATMDGVRTGRDAHNESKAGSATMKDVDAERDARNVAGGEPDPKG